MAYFPTDDDCAVVADCERALLSGSVRGDRLSAGLLIHADFREIGASGRVWDRAAILDLMEETSEPGRFSADDLVKGNNTIFVATGVTDGALVAGVRREGGYVYTESVVLRGASGTLRRISSEHLVSKWL